MEGNNRRGNPTFRVGRIERKCLGNEEGEGARHGRTDGRNVERHVGNLPATGPEHVQLSGKEVFSEEEEKDKGGINKETGEAEKLVQLL